MLFNRVLQFCAFKSLFVFLKFDFCAAGHTAVVGAVEIRGSRRKRQTARATGDTAGRAAVRVPIHLAAFQQRPSPASGFFVLQYRAQELCSGRNVGCVCFRVDVGFLAVRGLLIFSWGRD